MGSSVSSVELLLEARTAAESVVDVVSRQLAASAGVDGPCAIAGVVAGPAEWPGTMKFVAAAETGTLGALLVEPATVIVLADLIMGGRGAREDRAPSALEVELFTTRLLDPVRSLLDAVAPGRPEASIMAEGDYPAPARSLVIQIVVHHGDHTFGLLLEVLAHHVTETAADGEADSSTMEIICSDVPLELTFAFDPVRLHARDVAALQPGDVVCLDHDADKPLLGRVRGRPLVTGRVGIARRAAAVEVVDLIEGNA